MPLLVVAIVNKAAATANVIKTPPKTLPDIKYIGIKIKKDIGKTSIGYWKR